MIEENNIPLNVNEESENLEKDETHKNSNLMILVLAGLLVFSIVTGFLAYKISRQPKIISQEIVNTNPMKESSSTNIIENDADFFTITVRPAVEKISQDIKKPYSCQPERFIPENFKFEKVPTNGTPDELYKIEGFMEEMDTGLMMINGWEKENENKIVLPEPLDLTVYSFGCASEFSYVLDFSKNNKRQAIYTQVSEFEFSENMQYLYLVQLEKISNKWVETYKIIDVLDNNAEAILPDYDCMNSYDAGWIKNKLFTYNQIENNTNTSVCIWDTTGQLQNNIIANLYWGSVSKDFLADTIGILPNEETTFYAYTQKNENTCALYLFDTVTNSTKNIPLLTNQTENVFCAYPKVQLDLTDLQYAGGTVKYNLNQNETSPWQEIEVK